MSVDALMVRPESPARSESLFAMPQTPAELREHQRRYLNLPAYRYSVPARLMFWSAERIFPQGRSFEFFAFVELVARVPYMAWEHVGHIAQTQNRSDHAFIRRVQNRVVRARDEQDNEFWHLLIMEEFCEKAGYRRRLFRDRIVPQVLSIVYYQLAWLLYVLRPDASYRLNSDFEDHALRQYALFVQEHPEFDQMAWESRYRGDYGWHVTVGDMLRQIAWDEEQHKNQSDGYARSGARFS